MAWLLGIPLAVRLGVIALVGLLVASAINWAVDAWAWTPRHRSPWRRRPGDASPRTWHDRLPLIGWWRLRRESPDHGTGHWIRPLVVEISCAAGLASLYWWNVATAGLVAPAIDRDVLGGIAMVNVAELSGWLHAQYLAQAVLFMLMMVASLIDIDDRIIPDEVTVPGLLLALVLAFFVPHSHLPQVTLPGLPPSLGAPLHLVNGPAAQAFGVPLWLEPVHVAASNPWPAVLNGRPRWESLALGLSCWWLWCFAFTRRRWRGRRGVGQALKLLLRRVVGDLGRSPLREIAILGTLGVIAAWYVGGNGWQGLLTALVGMVAGGGAIWLVRIFASAALGKEAMGFGDVTLMMMVGAFIGWQASVLVFFLAPFAALVLGVVQLTIGKGDALPYGPFLCLATAVTIFRWGDLWLWSEPLFAAGPLVPVVLLVCLVLCGVLLAVWSFVKRQLLGD